MTDVAVAHEHWIEYGGGEYVAETLAGHYDAPLYTGLVDMRTPDGIDIHEVTADIPLRRTVARSVLARDAMYMLAWPNVDGLTTADVVIQSGNGPGWYVPTDEQAVVKYVHTTPRGAYDLYHAHDHGVVGTLAQHAVRTLYQQTIPYPDVWVANSELVARRVRRYFGIDDVRVVYPPVDTDAYDVAAAPTDERLFVTWSRLYENKNIEMIVRAFNRLGDDYHLVVGGTGPERDTLESLAGANVTFTGWLDEREKRKLASEAAAVIFAATNEDFGLVPIEAMAAGTPVIGVRDGYTQHQIRHGQNGLLFDDVRGIVDAVRLIEEYGVEWKPERIAAFARENYDIERFREQMDAAVKTAERRAMVSADQAIPREGQTRE